MTKTQQMTSDPTSCKSQISRRFMEVIIFFFFRRTFTYYTIFISFILFFSILFRLGIVPRCWRWKTHPQGLTDNVGVAIQSEDTLLAGGGQPASPVEWLCRLLHAAPSTEGQPRDRSHQIQNSDTDRLRDSRPTAARVPPHHHPHSKPAFLRSLIQEVSIFVINIVSYLLLL